MNENKIENLLNLSENERFEYFVQQAVNFGEVWTIANEKGYLIFKGNDKQEIFPVWTARELAERCMFQEHKEMGAVASKISLKSFLEQCIPDMESQGVSFGIFFNDKRAGLVISPEDLRFELDGEIDELYGE